ncbi:MAG: endopeptidase La [Clostridia bacterium]|nr:endopeptidase La [Clostridia bacterium]
MRYTVEKITERRLPVYKLDGQTLFPGHRMSVETDDDAVIRLCEKAEKNRNLILALPVKPDGSGFAAVGVTCRIERCVRMQGGSVKLLLSGEHRAEVRALDKVGQTTFAECLVKEINEETSDEDDTLMLELKSSVSELSEFLPPLSDEVSSEIRRAGHAGRLADIIAAYLLVDPNDKITVLCEFNPEKRAMMTDMMLMKQKELLSTQMRIHQKVKAALDRNQRDFMLREQMKAIRDELGMTDEEDEENDPEIVEYMGRIKAAPLPDEVREKLVKEVRKLAKMQYASAESSVQRNYLDAVLELPWGKRTNDRTDVSAAKKILDADHDGLDKIKERILEFIAVRALNPGIKNQIICLVGPPGTGKTSIAISLARALRRKYVRVSLGGVRDEADIRGHRKTYIGSMPGRIIEAITSAGSMNPLILLDEVDKLTRDAHGDPSSALLEVLDSEQNKSFRDHFIEVPFDLSECMFIATANDIENIPRPLLDRMEVIELKIYTRFEKLAIAKNHLIPKQLKRHGLNRRRMKFTDDSIFELIDFYTAEAGVRNLEREIASICRKVAKQIVTGEVKSVTLGADDVRKYLNGRRIIPDRIYDRDEVGVVNGLAYTELGGDLLRVEAVSMPGSGKIELTGSLGDVMKESAKAAITYIRSKSGELGIDPDFYKNKDIHIHVPEGAVPKDGPSAGVTIVTALTSELSGRPVRRDVAMTGEVTLHGRVLAIGGLKEKTMAAYKAGVNTVFIPSDNVKDIPELDSTVRENLTFVPCRTVDEVIKGAIRPENG